MEINQKSKRVFKCAYPVGANTHLTGINEWSEIAEWLKKSGFKYESWCIGGGFADQDHYFVQELKFFSTEAATIFKLTWC